MWSVQRTWKLGRRAAGFFGGLLVAFLLAAGPAAGAFVEPINLSNSPALISERPGIAVNGAGQVFVVWRDGNDIVFTRSRPTQGSCTGPGRLEFGAPVNLSAGTGTASVAAVAANDSGGVFVAWQAVQLPGSSEIWFRRSTDGGQNFLPAVNLSQNTGPSNFPTVAADNAGGVFVAWGDGSPPATGTQHEILFKRSTDFGATFEAAALLSQTPAANSRAPYLATDGSNLYLAWQEGSSSPFSILYKKFGRLDNLTTVAGSAAANLSSGLGSAFSPSLAFGDGRLSVAFVASNGPSAYHRWSSDGVAFSAPENLSGTAVSPSDARGARHNGSALVAWSEMLDVTTANTEIRYRLPGAMASPETVWPTPARSAAPAAAMDATGRLLVVWSDTVNGNSEIYLSYSGGTGGGTMMPATVWAAPRVLNYRTAGRGTGEQPNFTVFIEPLDPSAGNIIPGSVKLQVNGNEYLPLPGPSPVADRNNNGIPDVMVKFNRSVFDGAERGIAATTAQSGGNYTVSYTVTGSTDNNGCFRSGDAVQIMR